MSKFIIQGGRQLNGRWPVQGSKNAATPVLAATLLTRRECVIHNVPRISDVQQMLNILQMAGARYRWQGKNTVRIQTKKISLENMDYKAFKRMRSSVLFMGPLLASVPEFTILEPGGCTIGNRPLTTHFRGLEALGAEVIENKKGRDIYYDINSKNLQSGKIVLEEKSVTGTENMMMAATLISGTTVLSNVAREPHVASLGRFLRAMGADLTGEGTEKIIINGVSELHGAEFEIIPDQLEVGTIAVLAALCGGEIEISPIAPKDARVIADKLREAGVDFWQSDPNNSELHPNDPNKDKGVWVVRGSRNRLKSFKIHTAPFPGFPTDLQAPFGVLAAQASGESVIYDPMFENRLGYINELKRMGAASEIKDAHTAVISGPAALKGTRLNSLDLRAGATLIIAALAASGQTILNGAEIIDRGYERIEDRLRSLGARIERVP